MGRRGLLFNIGYLVLVLLLIATMLSGAWAAGEPLTQSPGFSTAVFFMAAIPMRVLRIWQSLRPRDFGALADANAAVTLREGIIERACSIVLGLGMTAMGALPLLGFRGPDVPDVFLVVILVMGCFVTLSCIAKPRARLTLSPEGLDWSQITPSFVPWDDLVATKVQRWMVFGSLAVFELKETGKYFPKLLIKRACKRFGIVPASFGVDAEMLIEAIEMRRTPHVFHASSSARRPL